MWVTALSGASQIAPNNNEKGDVMVTASVFHDYAASVRERRQFQRLHVAVQAELRVQGNEMPIRVETADISMGGCYVEMAVTLDVGTELNIVLWLGHEKLTIIGKVVTRHPQFGNGIEFSSLTQDARQRLRLFLRDDSPTSFEDHSRGLEKVLLV
jgi:c-di-GMP-binding flagellar brake protein YcgR